MAGDKQHYLPRFLLKGFARTSSNKKSFVWCFARGSKPLEVSLRDVGHSKLFYGIPGPGSLDDLLTEREGKYSEVVDRVRKDRGIHPADREVLAEFVYSQVIRTRNLRIGYGSAVVSKAREIHQELSNPDGMAQFMRDTISLKNKSRLQKELRKQVKSQYGAKLSRRKEEDLVQQILRNSNEWISKNAQDQAFIVDMAMSAALQNSDQLIKNAHNEALTQWLGKVSHEASSGLNYYHELRWAVHHQDTEALILGDVGVIHLGPDSSPPSAGLSTTARLVLLPLSYNLLLSGSTDTSPLLPPPDLLNRSAAELSIYFFISSRSSEREAEYHKLLGQKAPLPENEGKS